MPGARPGITETSVPHTAWRRMSGVGIHLPVRRRAPGTRAKCSGQLPGFAVDGAPDALGRDRHVDMADTQRTQRVRDGADDGRDGADDAGFAGPFDAERIARARNLV